MWFSIFSPQPPRWLLEGSLVHKVVFRSGPLGEGAGPFWAQFATFHFIKPCLTLLASVWQTQLRTSLSIPWGSSMSNLSSSVPLPERETREQSAEASPGVVNAANVQTTGAPCEERTKALTRLVVRGGGSQMPTERVVSFLLFIR